MGFRTVKYLGVRFLAVASQHARVVKQKKKSSLYRLLNSKPNCFPGSAETRLPAYREQKTELVSSCLGTYPNQIPVSYYDIKRSVFSLSLPIPLHKYTISTKKPPTGYRRKTVAHRKWCNKSHRLSSKVPFLGNGCWCM